MTFLKQISLLALAACLGLVLVGCQPSDPSSPKVADVTSIAVTPNPIRLEVGGVQVLTVTATLSNNSTYVVNFESTFVSSAPAIARVDASTGHVTALAAGTATITARHAASGQAATTTVTVAPLRVISIAVSPASRTLEPDASLALTVTATYNNATTGDVTSTSTFVSSDPAVAAVDATGVVTAVALGTATMTATHTPSGNTAEAAITVAESGDFKTITFDELGVTYELRGFGGAEDSTLQLDPTNATNTVARVNRSATAADFAGTVVSTGPNETVGTIPFSATNTRMTVRVYSPAAGIRVLLKVEDSTDVNRFAQTQAFTTVANAWETLTFDFANPFAGSAALNPSYNYDRLIIFFNFGVTGATAGAQTFYFDDVAFPTGGATAPTDAPTTVIPAGSVTIYSDAASVTGLDPFPDWGQNPPVTRSEVTIAGNKSLQYVWAGPGGLYQGIDWSANPVDVSTKGKLHIDFWSPDITSVKVSIISAGLENAYTQTLTTGGWNGVDIDLSNYTVPDKTAIIQIKLEPATPGTLYVDNIYFWGTTGGGGATAPTDAPTTVIPADAVTIYSDAASVTGLDPFPDWGQNPPVTRSEVTIAGNESLQYVWAGPGGLYQGLDWSANPVDVSTKGKLHIDFWTPDLASVKVSIISAGKENAYTQALTTGGWNSVDIDLSNYTVPDKSAIIQIKLEPNAPGKLYVDNIYFWGTAGGGGGSGALVTFDEAPPPKLTDFGTNGAPPVVDLDPAGGTNKVLKVFKYALPAPGSEQWAGVTVSTGANDSIPAIPFTATAKTMTVRVYSPAIGVRVRLKVENASNPAISCETDAITTQAGAWETLTFNFANPGLSPPVGGGATAPLDLAQTYNKISIFSDFGIGNGGSAPLPADRVYYYDDITF